SLKITEKHMSIKKLIEQNEKVFKGEVDLKYLFFPSPIKSDYLFVMFSAFNGSEELGVTSKYQYLRHTQDINCNKLYILDIYDSLPCYYLGKNKKLDYEKSVVLLISQLAKQINVEHGNIITCGSSKGGTAALYLAMKYSYGHTIVGGMQTRVGDYIYKNKFTRENVLKLITGSSDEIARDYLNDFYQSIFTNPMNNTQYNIHGGRGDLHYIEYVKPFIKKLIEKNIPCNIEVKDYNSHSELGNHYPDFLINNLNRIIVKREELECTLEYRNNDHLIIDCKVPSQLEKDNLISYAFYIYKNGNKEPVKKVMYTHSNTYCYPITEFGVYKAKVFIKWGNNKKSFYSNEIIINKSLEEAYLKV
ncbi:hypothetical protein CN514_25105, partial [Bacillus sp. AFS001701]|uniref:hypothetical protein n=1 Tax=Bacillus sp. AFS001701 TaxID=2033480 RepID=UPI000BF58273